MDYQTLVAENDSRGVVYLRLNLPDKRNALSAQAIAELTDFAQRTTPGAKTRAVVLSGEGSHFCAGGDLEWMRAQIDATRDERMAEAGKLAEMLRMLNELPVPLIGQVHGGAFGGGVGLACVCDTVIAAAGTKFGLTETRLGLIPATIGPYVLARLGEGRARRVFMSARIFDADEAKDLGIVSRVVPQPALADAIEAEVAPYLSTAPGAVAAAKALARSLGPRIDADVIADTIERLADTWETPESRAGIAAFFDKRPAPWVRKD